MAKSFPVWVKNGEEYIEKEIESISKIFGCSKSMYIMWLMERHIEEIKNQGYVRTSRGKIIPYTPTLNPKPQIPNQ